MSRPKFLQLPPEINSIIIGYLLDSYYDHPFSRFFGSHDYIISPFYQEVELQIPPSLLALRQVCKACQYLVDSSIYKAYAVHYDSNEPAQVRNIINHRYKRSFDPTISSKSQTIDQYDPAYSIIDNRFQDRNIAFQDTLKYLVVSWNCPGWPRLSNTNMFQPVVHLYINIHWSGKGEVQPQLDFLNFEAFPMLEKVTLCFQASSLPKQYMDELAGFFHCFSNCEGRRPLKVNVRIQPGRLGGFLLDILKFICIETLVDSLYIEDYYDTDIDYDFISEELINLKRLTVLYGCATEDNLQTFNQYETIRSMERLEELTLFTTMYTHNPFTAPSFIPSNLTRLSINFSAFLTATLICNNNTSPQLLQTIEQLQLYGTSHSSEFSILSRSIPTINNQNYHLKMDKLWSVEVALVTESPIRDIFLFKQLLTTNTTTIKKLHFATNDILMLTEQWGEFHSIEEFFLEMHNYPGNIYKDIILPLTPLLPKARNICVNTVGPFQKFKLNFRKLLDLIIFKDQLTNAETYSGIYPFDEIINKNFKSGMVLIQAQIARFLDRSFIEKVSPFEVVRPVIKECILPRDLWQQNNNRYDFFNEFGRIDYDALGSERQSRISGHFSIDVKKLRSLTVRPEIKFF